MILRLLSSLSRREHQVPKIVFTHLPKSAGSSVQKALSARVGSVTNVLQPRIRYGAALKAGRLHAKQNIPHTGLKDDLDYHLFLLSYYLYSGWNYLAGHLPVDRRMLDEFSDHYSFVTMIRDPVQRWISHYLFNKRMDFGTDLKPVREYNGSIEDEFAEVVSSGYGLHYGSLSTTLLTGRYPDSAASALEQSSEAIANLGKFAIVSTLEHIEQFSSDLSALIGKPIAIGRENQTEDLYQGDDEELFLKLKEFFQRNDVVDTVRSLCAADQKVYLFARERCQLRRD